MSDWKAELERVKAIFAKGFGALEILVSRANSDVEAARKKIDHNTDRLTKLESAIPDELREKITRFDIYIEQLEEVRRDHTGQIRTIRENELRDVSGIARKKIDSEEKVESRKTSYGVIIAVIAGVASLIGQAVQLIMK